MPGFGPVYPPDMGPDPVLQHPPGQPIPIAEPPADPYATPPQPVDPGQAAMELYDAAKLYNQQQQPGGRPLTVMERSALMYLEAAQKTLQAAVDELPALAPAVQQAGQALSLGIRNLLQSGQGFPIAQPPAPQGPPLGPESDSIENIPLPELM